MPAVVVTGARQTGKRSLVEQLVGGSRRYITLDDLDVLDAARREQLGLGTCGRWDELFATQESRWRELLADEKPRAEDWRRLATRGGFPTPALTLTDPADRRIWFDGYIRTYLERDLQDLSAVSSLPDFRRLMRAAALRLGQLVNQTELGRDVGLPQPTVHRWLNLLETSYLLVRLPAYAVNRTKRLIKSPKLYWGDIGVALNLGEVAEPGGAHLENLVLHDLLAWRDARLERAEYGKKTTVGLLLHTGTTVEWLAPDVLAAPWWAVV